MDLLNICPYDILLEYSTYFNIGTVKVGVLGYSLQVSWVNSDRWCLCFVDNVYKAVMLLSLFVVLFWDCNLTKRSWL